VRRSVALWVLVAQAAAAQASGGGATLQEAAEAARQAWLSHDVQTLVATSPNLVLQIPGADPSSPLGRAQAGELLRRYLRPVAERSLVIGRLEVVEEGKGFVELDRRYVVLGTSDLRRERLFLGFARVSGRWVLTELRSAP
jgi:hypothetical protein